MPGTDEKAADEGIHSSATFLRHFGIKEKMETFFKGNIFPFISRGSDGAKFVAPSDVEFFYIGDDDVQACSLDNGVE